MRKVKIIYNPSSGRQTIERRLNILCQLLIDDGYTISKFTTMKKTML